METNDTTISGELKNINSMDKDDLILKLLKTMRYPPNIEIREHNGVVVVYPHYYIRGIKVSRVRLGGRTPK